MERGLLGFLQSVILQILDSRSNGSLAESLMTSHPGSKDRRHGKLWGQIELRDLLEYTLKATKGNLLLFLDGLDEYN
jgi:hypothetical protein